MAKRMPQLAFGYPRRGLTGVFNTFRLGVGAVKDCQPGRVVELVDARTKKVLGHAAVLRVHVGLLHEMAEAYASDAHNWREFPDTDRVGLLVASMKKRYPPNRVHDDSVVSVFYLKEITHE
jgi:hypothetical protein